jgi:hypothetical protein
VQILKEKEYFNFKAAELKLSLRYFPDDFINIKEGKKIILPPYNLLPGKNFFGKIEVTSPNGTTWLISENLPEAKYLVYARQNGRDEVTLPVEESITAAVSEYENYLDLLMKEIGKEYRLKFPEGDKSRAITEIFRMLNLVRY